MRKNGMWSVLVTALVCSTILGVVFPVFGQTKDNWQIVVSKALMKDEAVKVALDDLEKTGIEFGILFNVVNDNKKLSQNSIIVGAPDRNGLTAKLVKKGKIKLQGVDDPQGYEIITKVINGNKTIIVSGGSLIGDVYGLYWIWDRIKVYKELPEINVKKVPDLKIRFTRGGSKEAIRNALKYGATWVWGGISVNNLVPWNVEPERTENEKNRQQIRELINYAHSLHLKFFVCEDEFSYHPSLLKEFGASLSPEDPAFWDAVQAKYRRLLMTLPEIDGVRIRTGESTRVSGNYKPFDVMHDGEGCDWSLAKRYRTFVKKIYNVVVGEFGKIYYQRTWVTSAHEQHSMAAVYKNIFTDDVPEKDLYLSPYLSTTDRYFHQPYNPTCNLTPHNMIVLLATLDYHSHGGVKTFPTFPGQYFQGGLKTIMSSESHNLKGVDSGAPAIEDWNTSGVTAYTVWRLAWDHNENVKNIVKDFASIHFGKAVAEPMADIYLLSPNVYKYGIYIEPVSYGDFNSLPHLRLTTFPAKGFPRIDNGKKHLEFLYKIYLRCKPWMTETFLYLDHGLDVANSMVEKFQYAKPLFVDAQLAKDVENAVELTYMLIKTNNLYVKTFFAYFDYRDDPTEENKLRLMKNSTQLMNSMQKFLDTPGCVYKLDGMEQLLKNVDQAIEDLVKAEAMLAQAPNDEGVKVIIAQQQGKYKQVLEEHANKAVKFLHWEGRVDGKDLINIKGDKLEVEHLRYDTIADMTYKFFASLPTQPVTVIPVAIKSRSFRPFVLEQPSQENNYTATIYLSDYPCHGYSWWEFELYYIPKPPEELGLIVPWEN